MEGSVGAGTGATVAKLAGPERAWKGGIGTASERLDTGVIVGALVAVNAVGSIRDGRTGDILAAPRADDGSLMDVDALLRTGRGRRQRESEQAEPPDGLAAESPSNTTLAVVATTARLDKAQVNRLATVAHDGLARAIWPVHTRGDGDVVFALATGRDEVTDDQYSSIEAMATLAVERAILSAVRHATGLGGVPGLADPRPRRRPRPTHAPSNSRARRH